MTRITTLLVAAATLSACATSGAETQIPGAEPAVTVPAGEAGAAGNAGTDATVQPTTTAAPATEPTATNVATTTAAPTTIPPTTIPPTTGAPTTAAPPPSTSAPAPPSTPAPPAPPITAVPLAACVDGELSFFTDGRRGEIALYQQTLANLGYNPGEIDGFFGQNTYNAASQEILDNGDVAGPEGVFAELFPDDGAVLPAAFERLGIGCSFEGDF